MGATGLAPPTSETLDWSLLYVDGTIVRAHQRAAGARRPTDPAHPDEALGRSQGGFSTKIHLRAEGGGKPIDFLITPGQRHEESAFEALMDRGPVKRRARTTTDSSGSGGRIQGLQQQDDPAVPAKARDWRSHPSAEAGAPNQIHQDGVPPATLGGEARQQIESLSTHHHPV
jgi:hypothetical protein